MFKKPLLVVKKPAASAGATQRTLARAVDKRRVLAAAQSTASGITKPVIAQMERLAELRIDRLRKKQ